MSHAPVPNAGPSFDTAAPVSGHSDDESREFLKHSTISKDQTIGSRFLKEQLIALDRQVPPASSEEVLWMLPDDNSTHTGIDFRAPLAKDVTLPVTVPAHTSFPYKEVRKFHPGELRKEPRVANRNSSTRNNNLPKWKPAAYQTLLDLPKESLVAHIQSLEQEKLQAQLTQHSPAISSTWQTFYTVDNVLHLEEPQWVHHSTEKPTLRRTLPVKNLDLYLERHKEIAFAVHKEYSTDAHGQSTRPSSSQNEVFQVPKPSREWVELVSEEMTDAVQELLARLPDFSACFPGFDATSKISAPYLFMYYASPLLTTCLPRLSPFQQQQIKLLAHFVDVNYGDEYRKATRQFDDGRVSKSVMRYLVTPGDVLVERTESQMSAYMAASWATETTSHEKLTGRGLHCLAEQQQLDQAYVSDADSQPIEGTSATRDVSVWSVNAWAWAFDGSFERAFKSCEIRMSSADQEEQVKITSLNIFPLRFASDELKQKLEKRGKIFWRCRRKSFVSYLEENDAGPNQICERFMIDMATYKKLHPEATARKQPLRADMGHDVMARDEPPRGHSLLLFPPTITGYNLRLKKWVDLQVDRISDVAWNKKAFQSLAVDNETKELIQALVTNQLAAEKSTDLIGGKGNGLIVLLHGGPGTGKTFTAESVAEIAEKPLYRVTCGDIGTKPEEVERYLESVLHLGKIWGCVVLLDEADVFLEERSLADLERNALVSVFLRVLEYYDGILILTSNRVGTFDEAFKSRIQLALHYENLTNPQRRKIWRNFINRLKSLEEGKIDFDDIEDHIDELAKEEMNGRQIRNAITTARQLAQYQSKKLCYQHLRHVINVAGRFDKYLKGVKEGYTDDQIARDGGLR